jgi:hypothetical protein
MKSNRDRCAILLSTGTVFCLVCSRYGAQKSDLDPGISGRTRRSPQ